MSLRIAKLNDALRRSLSGGNVYLTPGILHLPISARKEIIARVRSFEEFEEANDPYGDHDFGSFDHDGRTVLWKIDYYDRKLKWGSPDPADPAVTRRILTIMFAEEY
jgi:Protein of unknown function (DUF3768)